MKKHTYNFLAIFLYFICTLNTGHAQDFKLKGLHRPKVNIFAITLEPAEAKPDCEIFVYAALKRKQLSGNYARATLLTSIAWTKDQHHILTRNAPFFKQLNDKNRAKLFVRAIATCDLTVTQSAILVVKMKLNTTGQATVRSWFQNINDQILNNSYHLQPYFSALSFNKPVDLQDAPDQFSELYVVEQSGTIQVFTNEIDVDNSNIFLDISDKISFNPEGGERGLLGLAFHPNYQENGYFYVNYTEKDTDKTIVSRFIRNPANRLAALSQELKILEVEQPFGNHNAGQLQFGPDGYLYIGLGDGGSANDPFGHGQNRQTLLGSMLRIDINNTQAPLNYAIPTNNPFVGNTQGFREEIYAWGLRNPWRYSFDSQGRLWLADVGQGTREEVNFIKRGQNYGWNTMEASLCFSPATGCNKDGLKLPVFEYSRDLGRSITGGYVYQGSETSLQNLYIFADFISGRIWGLTRLGRTKKYFAAQLLDSSRFISSFGQADNGDIFVLDYSGSIHKLVKS